MNFFSLNNIFPHKKPILLHFLGFIILISLLFLIINYQKNHPLPMINNINNPKVFTYSYIDVTTKPYLFAANNNQKRQLYFLSDNNHMYIVSLTNTEVKTITEYLENNKSYHLVGFTKHITDNIQKSALENYNQEVPPEAKITPDEFKTYFGTLYLDTNFNILTIIVILITVIFFLFSLFLYFLIRHFLSSKTS